MIRMIACIGRNRELGKDNHLLFHLKEDMQFFRKKTFNNIVVMGRKTYESIGHELPNRTNIILSRNSEYSFEDILFFREDVWIIGGASLYTQFLPYAKEIYLTEVDADAEADTFFPEFDKSHYLEEVLKESKENDIHFRIKRYLLLDSDSL